EHLDHPVRPVDTGAASADVGDLVGHRARLSGRGLPAQALPAVRVLQLAGVLSCLRRRPRPRRGGPRPTHAGLRCITATRADRRAGTTGFGAERTCTAGSRRWTQAPMRRSTGCGATAWPTG